MNALNKRHFSFSAPEHDPSSCFELFRRALCEQDQQAWAGLMAQYRTLVRSWVERHPAYHESGETHEYFINRTFEKLWLSIDRKKFQKFGELSALLRYVQMCVHSVLIDHHRANAIAALQDELGEGTPIPDNPSPEAHALDRVQGSELWEYVEARANGKQEKLCLYASFVLGLKPRQILEYYPKSFKDTDEIYLVKQNVIARLRRDERFASLFKDGD